MEDYETRECCAKFLLHDDILVPVEMNQTLIQSVRCAGEPQTTTGRKEIATMQRSASEWYTERRNEDREKASAFHHDNHSCVSII